MRHMTPLLLGALPFGVFLGVTVAESSIPDGAGFLSGLIIFGGSAQLIAYTLMAEGAPVVSVLSAALVINARHLMYSAAMVPMFRGQPGWFRWLGPYVLIDQVFALVMLQADRPPAEFRRYYLTVGLFFFVNWQWATALGMLVGPIVPES